MRLSDEKKQKISEQIISLLFDQFPTQLFTAQISKELARDEEFTKGLLYDLKEKGLVISIKKNKKGELFLKRTKWQLSSKTYSAYSNLLNK